MTKATLIAGAMIAMTPWTALAAETCSDLLIGKVGRGIELIDGFAWEQLPSHADAVTSQLECLEVRIDPALAGNTHWVVGVAAWSVQDESQPPSTHNIEALAALGAVAPHAELPFWAHEKHPLTIAFHAASERRFGAAATRDEERAIFEAQHCVVHYDGSRALRPLARATIAQCIDPESDAAVWSTYLFASEPLPQPAPPVTTATVTPPTIPELTEALPPLVDLSPEPAGGSASPRAWLGQHRQHLLWAAGGTAVAALGLGLGSALTPSCADGTDCSPTTKTGLAAASAGAAGLSGVTIGLAIAGEW